MITSEPEIAHCLSSIFALLEEVEQVRGPNDPFVVAIETAQYAHERPLLIAISTQAATYDVLFSIWLDDAANSADSGIVSHLHTAPKD